MGITCEACNIVLDTGATFQAHINGKKHKKAMKIMEDEKNILAHQAHVTWKKDIDKNQLESFVMKFGPLKSIFLKKEFRFAIVDFEKSEACAAFLSNDKHELPDGTQISVNKRASKKRTASTQSNRNVTPSRPGNRNEDSDVSPQKSSKKKAKIFENKSLDKKVPSSTSFHDASSNPHLPSKTKGQFSKENFLCGPSFQSTIVTGHSSLHQQATNCQNVNIEKSSENSKAKDGCSNAGDVNSLINMLMKSKSVDDQMIKLVEVLRLTNADIKKRRGLADLIKNMVSAMPGLSKTNVHLFGSSANGMGIKGCDLDLILNVKCDHEVTKLMKIVRGRLHSCQSPKFKDIIAIRSKRCPIIRFYCPALDLKCDLSFNNYLATRNTEVLKFLGEVVPEFRVLCYVLRKWAGSVEVGGNVSGGPKLTHYSLYMLVWFYVRSRLNLPSFEDLSLLQGEREYIDQWDCSFPFDQPHLFQSKSNSSSLMELLVGFFDFFKEINFENQVLCIRSGNIIPYDHFEKMESFSSNFQKTSLMVRDPFLLEHNITQNVTNVVLARLQNALKESACICSQPSFASLPSSGNTSSEKAPWGIVLLMNQKPPADIEVAKHRSSKPRIFSFKIKKHYGEYMMPPDFSDERADFVNELEANVPCIVNEVAAATEKVLHDIFLVQINSVTCCPLKSSYDFNQNSPNHMKVVASYSKPLTTNSSMTTTTATTTSTLATIPTLVTSVNGTGILSSTVTISSARDGRDQSNGESPWRPWPSFLPFDPEEKRSEKNVDLSLVVETGIVDDDEELLEENNFEEEETYKEITPHHVNSMQMDEIGLPKDEVEVICIDDDDDDDDNGNEMERDRGKWEAELDKENDVAQCNENAGLSNGRTRAGKTSSVKQRRESEGYVVQFDCRSTRRTWVGRQKYKRHFTNVRDCVEREALMTRAMTEANRTKSNGAEEMAECALPFGLKVVVKPANPTMKHQTMVCFYVTMNETVTKKLVMEFNNLMNCFSNIIRNALTSL